MRTTTPAARPFASLRRFALLPLSLVLGLAGCVQLVGERPADQTPLPPRLDLDYRVQHDQLYTPPDWPQPLHADVYMPQAPMPAGGWPAVLVIHGGGWRNGDREQVRSIARRLAQRGYVAVNIEYRLVPAYRFPAPLQDLQQAVRWLRANAATYQVNPQRVAAWGYSAGAHLAALLGGLSPGDPNYAEGARVQAVVGGGTPADLRKFHGGTLVPDFLGEHWRADSEVFKAASPAAWVSADDPPVFLYHGNADSLVPPDQAIDYQRALDAAGVPNQLYLVRGLGHIPMFLFDWGAVQAGADFLDRQLRR